MGAVRSSGTRMLVAVFVVLIYTVPLVASVLPLLLVESVGAKLALLCAAPITFMIAFVGTAGILSRIGRRAVIAGTFPRDLAHRGSARRRLHAVCWTAVYHSGPIYYVVLTLPRLRRLTLGMFGYRGDPRITLFPDTWIRDLPLLEIGAGAYLSSKVTLGTSICMQNGDILVDKIRIGERAVIGHLAMLAPGATVGARAEIGAMAHVGVGARIGDGVRIPDGAVIPARAVVATPADVARYVVHLPVGLAGTETSVVPVIVPIVSRTPSAELVGFE